ncbi:MAG: hypothetical protein A2782_03365 [Candidatus Blackburnbacteria bacterium RIFCSPHIGHO2_01_FULL_43_15b]|uniref:Polysaccharide biosynthesis protein C-terminal domain-containing protein n=1 Tax=Candidatus Blackburnbacteria bacterium RIFCSPHIGHO2_01_FULL_43_15b TaxID=1797513 RepID=A0A1G1V2H7_9BACT|nr:MAG: hypothetical protein A2782_03365 [Candidatus Blackburnbacteria bacterium RIFCSPHIGHO2_01_FULL_43_15b]
MDKIKRLIFSGTAKNTSALFAGNMGGAVLAVLFTLLVARRLGPEEWGVVAAVISLITIAEALGDFGLASSLYRFFAKSLTEQKHQEAEDFRHLAFFFRILTAGLVFLILVIFSGSISSLVFKTDDSFLTFVSGLGIFSYLMLDFQVASLQTRGKWGLSAFFIAFVNLIRLVGVYLLFAQGKLNLHNTLWMYSGTPLATLLLTFFWQPTRLAFVKHWTGAKNLLFFSGWLGLNRIAAAIASRIDVILLLDISGAYQTGLFGASKQLAVGVPMLVGSLATVLAPRFATLEERALSRYFKKSIALSVFLAFGLLSGILISPLVISLFGDEYEESRGILQWLLVGYIPFVISMPAVNLLIYALHKPKIIGILSLLQIPLVWWLNVYLIPLYGVWGAVAVHIVWNLSTLLVAYAFVGYYLGKKNK